MATTTEPAWLYEPFVMRTAEEFAGLREWLVRTGYTEERIRAETGYNSVYDLPALSTGRTVFTDPVDKLSLLVLLFLDAVRMPWALVESILAPADRAILDAFGLIRASASDSSSCVATVALYPIEGLYFVSDRHGAWEVEGDGVPSDVVFSGLTPNTHEFVGLMPRVPCADYLELCSGAGIAAVIAASQFAGQATAVDITERSTRFAAFNVALNGINNATALQGDLYEPVLGKSFDVITAHPPYVPSFDTEVVYRDGGADGEQVTRAIIEGLPQFLRPGGRFFCSCMISDRTTASAEQRIREFLGEYEAEFDVVLVQVTKMSPVDRFADTLMNGRWGGDLFVRRIEAFNRLGIESFVTGMVMIQRRRTMRPVGTRRRIITNGTTSEDMQWLLGFVAATAEWEGGSLRHLLDAKPRCLPRTELHSRSVLSDGTWRVYGADLVATAPFAMKAECPPWFPSFLAACDGTTTVAELYTRMVDAGQIAAEGTEEDFARLVFRLADAPFIELPMLPVPSAHPNVTDA